MERPLVQILVVVAIIQMRPLKTEAEKGSVWTVIGHGLAGPKEEICFFERSFAPVSERVSG